VLPSRYLLKCAARKCQCGRRLMLPCHRVPPACPTVPFPSRSHVPPLKPGKVMPFENRWRALPWRGSAACRVAPRTDTEAGDPVTLSGRPEAHGQVVEFHGSRLRSVAAGGVRWA
jgi:hypothetical protein